MAEALFAEMVAKRSDKDQWTIDSAATSTYEIGSEPDDRTNRMLQSKKHSRSRHIARQVCFNLVYFICCTAVENMIKIQSLFI